jgi:hypothetical protein
MAKFSQFKIVESPDRKDGRKDVWVNPDYVRSVESGGEKATNIYLFNEPKSIRVEGEPASVIAQLSK